MIVLVFEVPQTGINVAIPSHVRKHTHISGYLVFSVNTPDVKILIS